MPKTWLVSALAASVFVVLAVPSARAQDRVRERGAKTTTERDESEMDRRARARRMEVFILRGTQPRDEPATVVETPPAPAKTEPRKMKTIHRGHRTFKVPAE